MDRSQIDLGIHFEFDTYHQRFGRDFYDLTLRRITESDNFQALSSRHVPHSRHLVQLLLYGERHRSDQVLGSIMERSIRHRLRSYTR